MSAMKRTKETATTAELEELFSAGPDPDDRYKIEDNETVIATCAGEWRREPNDRNLWRAWDAT